MESKRCRQVDLARATLPPGAPLDPDSAAHVRSCARCQDAARLDAEIAASLRRSCPPLPQLARRRLERAVARPAPAWALGLALAAGLLCSLLAGRLLRPVVHQPPAVTRTEDAPLLERLVARHLGRDTAAAPVGVVSETRLPETLAIGVVDAPTRTAGQGGPESASHWAVERPLCPVDAEPGASSLFVLDRTEVEVEQELATQLAERGVVSVVLEGQRVTLAAGDTQLFVTVTTMERPGQLAGR